MHIFKLKSDANYRYVDIGAIRLAFHGMNIVAFTGPDGGLKLANSAAFSHQLETAATYEELQNRAMLAIASSSNVFVQKLMDKRLTGKK